MICKTIASSLELAVQTGHVSPNFSYLSKISRRQLVDSRRRGLLKLAIRFEVPRFNEIFCSRL